MENQTSQAVYLTETIPILSQFPNVIGHISCFPSLRSNLYIFIPFDNHYIFSWSSLISGGGGLQCKNLIVSILIITYILLVVLWHWISHYIINFYPPSPLITPASGIWMQLIWTDMANNYSVYFDSARWQGLVEQFDLWGRHCIRTRSAFATYALLNNFSASDLNVTSCVFVYDWCIYFCEESLGICS